MANSKKDHISKENIIKIRKTIRKKLRLLRQGDIVRNEQLHKSFEPVTQSLKELVKTEQDIKDVIINENLKKEQARGDNVSKILQEDVGILPRNITNSSNSDNAGDEDDDDNVFDATNLLGYEEVPTYLESYNPLPRQYIEQLITDGSGEFDTKTGVKYNAETSKWTVGKSPVEIDGDDLIIDGLRYTGTPGLYELLFKKNPLGYTEKDGNTYIDILNRSKVLHRNFDSAKQKWGSKSSKYQLIKKLMLSKKTNGEKRRRSNSFAGMGYDKYLIANEKPYNYKYWNNVEELVDRLVLLHAARGAGNDTHTNEIVAIEEELREADIIT